MGASLLIFGVVLVVVLRGCYAWSERAHRSQSWVWPVGLGALAVVALVLSTTGCARLAKPQKPGRSAVVQTGPALSAALTQPENPQGPSSQTTEQITRTFAVASAVSPSAAGPASPPALDLSSPAPAPLSTPTAPPGAAPLYLPVTEQVTRTTTTIGAAQKDESRSIAARLAGMRPVQIAGIVLVCAGLAMFHPVVKAVTMSTTLQVVTGATGLLLIFAPMVIAGNEHLLILVGLGLPAIWFVVHRHGRLQGFVDANRDGIDDRRQNLTT